MSTPDLSAEVMAAVDKMAEFKVRNGEAFEKLIREKQRDNPKFAFLFDTSSPAHAYYQQRLQALSQAAVPPQQQYPQPQMFPHQPPMMPYAQMPPHFAMAGAPLPPPPPPPSGSLSAVQLPVGLLATVLRRRDASRSGDAKRSLSFTPLRADELPRTLPNIEPPQAPIAAARCTLRRLLLFSPSHAARLVDAARAARLGALHARTVWPHTSSLGNACVRPAITVRVPPCFCVLVHTSRERRPRCLQPSSVTMLVRCRLER